MRGRELADAYDAMDVFAFVSKTESQGMVPAEALASKCPVVALDAPGARDIVKDGMGGRLVQEEDEQIVSNAIAGIADLSPSHYRALREGAFDSVRGFGMKSCALKTLEFYRELIQTKESPIIQDQDAWLAAVRSLERRWDLWRNRASSVFHAFMEVERPG